MKNQIQQGDVCLERCKIPNEAKVKSASSRGYVYGNRLQEIEIKLSTSHNVTLDF